jgi:hypothetical protein
MRRPKPKVTNRLRAVLLHVPWYTIEGQARLARDCGVYRSTIGRLCHNQTSPTYALARAVTDSVSRRLGVPIDIRELFSTDGTYPTERVCDLTPRCRGCFPPEAFTEDGSLRPEYEVLRPGDWCTYTSDRPIDTSLICHHDRR